MTKDKELKTKRAGKLEKDKHSEVIRVRMLQSEIIVFRDWQKIQSLAGTVQNESKWIRQSIVKMMNDNVVLDDSVLPALREANKQLSAIGRNLNQISRAVNMGKVQSNFNDDYVATLKDYIELVMDSIGELVIYTRKIMR